MNKKNRVICCGSIAYDLISSDAPSKGGYTFEARPGGSVLNTSIHLARLGLNVSLISKTGTDPLSDSLIEIMKKEKIDTSRVLRDDTIKTGLAIATLDRRGDPSYIFDKTTGPQVAFGKALPLDHLSGASVFHTGSAYSYADHSFEDAFKLIVRAKRNGAFTTYDPNWREGRTRYKRTARKRIKKIIEYVDLLKLSDTDATGITGARTLSKALRRLPPRTVVTLGEKGSFLWTGKKRIAQKAFKVRIADTIGAGDAFTAGLIWAYCSMGKDIFREEPEKDLVFAAAVSALVCTGRGATEGLKSADQVRKFLKARSN